MITQVIFKIDKKLKDKAMKKPAKRGHSFLPHSLSLPLKAFVENQFNVGW